MSRKTNNDGAAAVSSTPFPKRTGVSKLFKDVFENQSLSPIPPPMQSIVVEQNGSFSTAQRAFKPTACSTIEPVKRQKRLHGLKKKESATSKALREMKEKKENNLYHSRNLYTMHPEPGWDSKVSKEDESTSQLFDMFGKIAKAVVLDSDEEEINLPTTHNAVCVESQATKTIQGNKKQKLDLKLDSGSVDELENVKNTKRTARINQSKKIASTVTKYSRKVLECKNINKKKMEACGSIPKVETKPKPYQFDEIDSLFNLDSSDEEEDCNDNEPKIHTGCTPQVENITNKSDVSVAPSTSKVNEHSNNISSFVEVHNGKEKTFSRQLNCVKVAQKVEALKSTNFPEDCVSKFREVIFRPNRICGGIVAKALHTDNVDFGYVEITKDQTFLGAYPKVTFVMIEGEVNISQGELKETLVPGDMLHMAQDGGYQITNVCNRNARLMYIKELRN